MAVSRLNLGTTNQVLVKAAAGQTSNILEAQNSSGTVVAGLTQAGVWSGSAAPGLVLLNTTSFSGVASVSAPASTFTSAYRNYRILIYSTNSVDSQLLNFRVRAAGSDLTTGTYRYATHYGNSASDSVAILNRSNTATAAGISYQGVRGNGVQLDIFNPQLADYTHITTTSSFSDATNIFWLISTGFVNNTTSYDSFTIFPAANNMTGVMHVYGYNA